MAFVLSHGFRMVEFDADYLKIVNILNFSKYSFTQLGRTVENIRTHFLL